MNGARSKNRVRAFVPALAGFALVFCGALAALTTPGCGSSDSNPFTSSTSTAATTCKPTTDSIQAIFTKSCALESCHTSKTPAAGLNLSGPDVERQLSGVGSGTCDGWDRVVPGAPEQSLLWAKLYSEAPPCGAPMPLGGHLHATELGCIREWIRKLPPVTGTPTGGDGGTGTGPGGCEMCGGSACVDLTNDPSHCGSCSVKCPAGSACAGGTCSCDNSLTFCGGACVDTQSNVNHCGGCDTKCPSGAICSGGCVCANGLEECGGACIDPQSDPKSCGGCGNVCSGTTTVCLDGACSSGCGSRTDCAGACVDTQTSAANCGACGTVCSGGASCVSGSCVCPSGTSDCGGACINTLSDPSNCGACGTVCGGGQVCNAGNCGCPGGGTACGGRCVDTQIDSANCGTCGNVCGSGETCTSGACQCSAGTVSLSRDVQPIFSKSCALRGCHGATLPKEGLDLSSGASYSNLVNVAAKECTGRLRVKPGDPAASYLVNKLMGVNLCFGSQMPKSGTSLPKAELDSIGTWICNGAPND